MNGEIKSLVEFQHGVSPWWGVTVFWREVTVEKLMFSSKLTATTWLELKSFKKPYKFVKSPYDLYTRFVKA